MKSFQPKPDPHSPPYVIAHRGISGKAPENTLAAFSLAANTPGIDMIELDVRLSKDEQVIVLHDRTLQRTTTGNGAARKYTLAELKALDAGSWFDRTYSSEKIPTLHEVLEKFGKQCWINIELKSDFLHREPGRLLEQKVLDVVNQCGVHPTVLYSSFDHQLIANVKRLDPEATTGVIYSWYRDFGRMPSKLAGRVNASVFVCAKHELRPSMMRDANQSGIAVYVYTLNSTKDVQKMMALGVHGILSDNADDIVAQVKGKN